MSIAKITKILKGIAILLLWTLALMGLAALAIFIILELKLGY